MTEDEIKEIQAKQEETLFLVKKIWRAEKWRQALTILKFVILIGVAFGAFYFVTPYVEKLTSIDLQKLLEQLQSVK